MDDFLRGVIFVNLEIKEKDAEEAGVFRFHRTVCQSSDRDFFMGVSKVLTELT